MNFGNQSTLYDVLDLKPDATPEEIREAYLRIKMTYNRDSVALYTLVSAEETRDVLKKIEEAYETLSSPERRRQYDRHHGLLSIEQEFVQQGRPSPHRKIISIDRVPPMEAADTPDDLLVAPATDFSDAQPPIENDFFQKGEPVRPRQSLQNDPPPVPPPPKPQARDPGLATSSIPAFAAQKQFDPGLTQEIVREVDWRGSFLRKIREQRKTSIEELSAITKISKAYITAIEEEHFARLPAPVYLRGFVIQIAKVLKLPVDKVVGAYMLRYHQAKAEKGR